MTKDDILTQTRTRLTRYREDLATYENLWTEYQKREPSVFKNDVKNTFTELLYNFKQLLWEVELYCISHETLQEQVNILQKFLLQSPHILNNSTVKNELDNELRILLEKYETQSRSFLRYFDREKQ
jgi:hypothetical protein